MAALPQMLAVSTREGPATVGLQGCSSLARAGPDCLLAGPGHAHVRLRQCANFGASRLQPWLCFGSSPYEMGGSA